MRVVVVGAGFAGLIAADRIARSGQQVVVLEARDRVGGRVWSAELVPGDPRTVIERGAEFVLDGYDVMRSVLAELGLELADTTMSYYDREPRDPAVPAADVARCAEVIEAAAATAPPGTSLSDLLESMAELPSAALAAYVSRITVTNGIGARDLAAAEVADVTSGLRARPTWRVAGGNGLLADGLAARLGSAIWLSSPVRAIEQHEDGVRVLTPAGEVEADRAIIAVPMAILRNMQVNPVIPARSRDAWDRAGVACNAKLHVPLTAPAAPSAVQSVKGAFWTWTATDGSGQVQPVLHAFGGTATGLAALGVDDGPEVWAARVAALRPELATEPRRALLTTWNDDPWAGESYSANTTRVAPGDDDLIRAPVGRLHFAGEHTAGDWAGLMEGALRSGIRVADEVLARDANSSGAP
jgi:monoamine oxidase